MYVRDSKRQGLRVRYVDDTFYFPFYLSARLPSDHTVNRCSPWLRAEEKVHFFYFYESHFLPHFSFHIFTLPFFSFLTFPSLIVDEGARRDPHYKYLYSSLSWS